jgi:hypothetical protein
MALNIVLRTNHGSCTFVVSTVSLSQTVYWQFCSMHLNMELNLGNWLTVFLFAIGEQMANWLIG